MMKILLLGLEFNIGNKGCEALAYSFASFLDSLLKEMEIDAEIYAFNYAAVPETRIPDSDRVVHCVKVKKRTPIFWKMAMSLCKECDIIFDFTMGDSFSDIYGFNRFFYMTLLKQVAIWSGTPLVLAPQTYGPFKSYLNKKWASHIIKKSMEVFTRDVLSAEYIKEISGVEAFVTTDVAFMLKADNKRTEVDHSKVCVGINPSGLIWQGGYTGNNELGIVIDYKKYLYDVVEYLCRDDKYNVYLIPHVGCGPEIGGECDYGVCKELNERFPSTKVIVGSSSAMDTKGYIAEMDIFLGARMHATIGAFSSGVATIPFSYSRKFEGLYGSVNYHYVINGRDGNTENAVNQTILYIDDYKNIKADVEESLEIVHNMQEMFKDKIKEILSIIKEQKVEV